LVTSYILENDKDFQAALDRLAATCTDFRIPFGLISKEFYKSNQKMFKLKSQGLYPDLGGFNPSRIVGANGETGRDRAKRLKKREVGFVYPLLVRTGRLASSLVNSSDPETVNIVTKSSLVLGTDVPYAIYHQSDKPRRIIPQRKVVFIDGGPLETSRGASTSGRRETWLNIINDYILSKIEEEGFSK